MIPNIAQILSTAAIVVLDGVTIRPKKGLTFKPLRSTFDIETATAGIIAKRINETGAEISLTPDGEFTASIGAVLHPYSALNLGDTLAAVIKVPCASITTATDVITKVAHGLATGAAVKISYSSIAPTVAGGFPRNVTLYVRAASADTFTLHTSANGAAGDGTVDRVDFTAQGTGTLLVSRMRTLVIKSLLGVVATFHNVMISTLPNLRFSAGETLFQQLTIRCLHKTGTAPGANSLYTISEAAFADDAIDEGSILTLTPSVYFGTAAPWDDLPVGSSVEVDFTMQTSEILADATRLAALRFGGFAAAVKLSAPGLTWAETLEKLGMTGARGGTVAEDVLTVSTNALIFTMRAVLDAPDLAAMSDADMVGPLTFSLVRPHTSGVPDAWYSLALD